MTSTSFPGGKSAHIRMVWRFGSAKPQDGAIASQSRSCRWTKLWIPGLAEIDIMEYTIELGPSEGKHTTNDNNNSYRKSEDTSV